MLRTINASLLSTSSTSKVTPSVSNTWQKSRSLCPSFHLHGVRPPPALDMILVQDQPEVVITVDAWQLQRPIEELRDTRCNLIELNHTLPACSKKMHMCFVEKQSAYIGQQPRCSRSRLHPLIGTVFVRGLQTKVLFHVVKNLTTAQCDFNRVVLQYHSPRLRDSRNAINSLKSHQ